MDPDAKFDDPLGTGTGAGVIFGASGGVMEAALRTAVERISGQQQKAVEFYEVRGIKGCKEAEYTVQGRKIRIAAVSGLANAKTLLEKVRSGEVSYDFIEIMACPGGCVNGGGQPQQQASVKYREDIRTERAQALYDNDAGSVVRKSHENKEMNQLYTWFLGKPGSEKAHEVLHTTYKAR